MNEKYVLVTGGAGFIGSNWIWNLLMQYRNVNVVNLDSMELDICYENNEELTREFPTRYYHIQGRVEDWEQVRTIFTLYPIEMVFHFAAESHVDRSLKDPFRCVRINMEGTLTLLEACREFWKSREDKLFFYAGTDEVFGDKVWAEEDSPYRPSSPYSASKAGAMCLINAYQRTYDLPVLVFNSTNVYGPRQDFSKLIPKTILNAYLQRPVPVYGKGEQRRSWLYIGDYCAALHRLLKLYRKKGKSILGTYNIGNAAFTLSVQNLELVKLICHLVDEFEGDAEREKLIKFVPDRPGHDWEYRLCCLKIRTTTGWEPKLSLVEGLRVTVKWYLSRLKNRMANNA